MQKSDLGEREYLSKKYTAVFFGLSPRRLERFLKADDYDFVVYYKKRTLILREAFNRYLWRNPDVREMLKRGKTR